MDNALSSLISCGADVHSVVLFLCMLPMSYELARVLSILLLRLSLFLAVLVKWIVEHSVIVPGAVQTDTNTVISAWR